ncbi:phosphatidylinositol 4-kinase, putative [Ichthyophthirius multifiliis]|uniref:1-phosphatidylinositol 4-kinase n=1 Tax=Ichthyophthirius multifiliis TaxID=5932 RepID=G0QQY8_ICHMU|nr:phosphatidylinositol 4-kinase, putative [Ichthyophthirius multifiliis]EGR32366.1 phosphatidylinositol 4-kinase, putative [Ichthyophthirius multifiliis]|eukprot:XP_004035852.1 phosphatidylinositol 4-kinase, putative [Ichthyophthirius multifiliis]
MKFMKTQDENIIILDLLQVLIRLYIQEEDDESVISMLCRCRINPNTGLQKIQREDLEFYIPQICNYIVFQQELKNQQMIEFLQTAGKVSIYFSHLLYFYLKSLTQIVSKKDFINFPLVEQMVNNIGKHFQEFYQNFKIETEQYDDLYKDYIQKYGTEQFINEQNKNNFINMNHIQLNNYEKVIFFDENQQQDNSLNINSIQLSIKKQENNLLCNLQQNFEEEQEENIQNSDYFFSTINFFEDLIKLSIEINKSNQKQTTLQQNIQKINKQLPANVYIPFFQDYIRNYVILNIVISECKIYHTKDRAPIQLCVEVFRPDLEELYTEQQQKENIVNIKNLIQSVDIQIQEPLTVNVICLNFYQKKKKKKKYKFLKKTYFFFFNIQRNIYKINKKIIKTNQLDIKVQLIKIYIYILIYILKNLQIKQYKDSYNQKCYSTKNMKDKLNENPKLQNLKKIFFKYIRVQNLDISYQNQTQFMNENCNNTNENSNNQIEDIKKLQTQFKQYADILFGQDVQKQEQIIKSQSIFQNLKTYKLIHFIVKTGDNIKQEQFASQLINQFDQIFKDEGLNLQLLPYEIISLEPDSGIIKYVQNSVSIDKLKRSLHENFKNVNNLFQFFQLYYGKNLKKAQENFCSSLAAYSLVCYFLQIKDRHNGNILLLKDGHITHIDFGYLISNAPGKGLNFENNVPFKLINEYIEILGGVNSDMFKLYRKLFFKLKFNYIIFYFQKRGFMAAKKNQDRILILAKMFYCGYGQSLPCFEKGEQAIEELEVRFNPQNIHNDGEYYIYTQNLINQSLDHWRARWYDKYQYFFEGIFY